MAPNAEPRSTDILRDSVSDLVPTKSRVISRNEFVSHTNDTALGQSQKWIAIKGKVYDVTNFDKEHPGGAIVYTYSGLDATDVFGAFHTGNAYKMLNRFYVGDIEEKALVSTRLADEKMIQQTADSQQAQTGKPTVGSKEYYQDIVDLKTDLVKNQKFNSSKLFYIYKFLTNVSILSLAVLLVRSFPSSYPVVLLAAVVLGLFWQQCGWLAHDFAHHQVFQNRFWGNFMTVIVGNVFQGFSTSWWKMKHNHHHATPNVVSKDGQGDPDILTMPVLLWSERIIEGDCSVDDLKDLPQFLVKHQNFLYWPILCMARTSWVIQSILFQFEPVHQFVGGYLLKVPEIIALMIHHVSFFWLLFQIQGHLLRLLFYIISQGLGGLFIGVVFTVGHNAMNIYSSKEQENVDFVNLQVRTTRNVEPTYFNQWFTGGLAYQVEHHIWPTLPRHSLPYAASILKKFCAKYEIPYTCEGLVKGNLDVARELARIGDVLKQQQAAKKAQ